VKDEHTYKDLVQVARQIRADKVLPTELNNASSLLLFLWALATVEWKMAATLFEELLAQYPEIAPIWGGLLAHLIQLGPTAEAQTLGQRNLPKLLDLHLLLAKKLDPEEEGLLRDKGELSDELIISPLVQTFWIWSNQAIIALAEDRDKDVLPLILLNEVSVFEINARLWMPKNNAFGQIAVATSKLSPAVNFQGFLPLFAAIPDQEIAEQMYVELKTLGLPINQEEQPDEVPDIPLPTVFMLYVGLLEYEMHAAALNLKQRYASTAKENVNYLVHRSVALLWEKY
jgi:hypothetical protein